MVVVEAEVGMLASVEDVLVVVALLVPVLCTLGVTYNTWGVFVVYE